MNLAIFSSSPITPGTLLFDYLTPTTYATSHPLAFLSEFQIHRKIHGIIGILDCSEFPSNTLSTALESFHSSLKDLPNTFATKVYGFDSSPDQIKEAGQSGITRDGLVLIPSTGDVGFYLNTLLADFASDLLYEFSNMAAQLESRTSILTPQETAGISSPFTYIPHRPTAKSQLNSYAGTSTHSPTGQRPINLSSLGISPPPQSRTAVGAWGASQSGNQDGFLYGKSIQSNMTLQSGSAPSPPPGMIDQKSRKKVAGRERKLMGDMWLLAGRLNDAIACYNESILLTKSREDSVWQASALEGLSIALVIQAWCPTPLRFNSQPTPSSPGGLPPIPNAAAPSQDSSTFLSSIPKRLSQAIALYQKMLQPLITTPSNEDLPPPDPDRTHPLIYAEACLRCARFLLAVSESGGWIDRALDKLILPLPKYKSGEEKSSIEQARLARMNSLSASNTVPRFDIAEWISLAHAPQLVNLALPIRLKITGEIASLFGRIGYRRKESFVLREIAALCGVGVIGKGVEVFTAVETRQSVSGTIYEESEFPSPLLNGRKDSAARKSISAVRTSSDSAGNESVIQLVEKVCDAFGIQVVPKAIEKREESQKSTIQRRQYGRGGENGKKSFGWSILQAGILKDAISIAEALPDHQAAIRFTVTALRSLTDTLSRQEQIKLSQSIPRAFAAAIRRGVAFDLEYWGPSQLVMSMEVTPLSQNRLPFEHTYQDVASDKTPLSTNAFIYNPKKGQKVTKAIPTIVKNEATEVLVTLQNPFLFDLDIQSIELSTTGITFDCDPLSTIIPAGSFHTVRLSGIPRESGTLVIRGCYIRLAGCTIREFLLPIYDEEEEKKRQKASILDTSQERPKLIGLDAIVKSKEEEIQENNLKFLTCNVAPEMPLLWMRSTSLTHGALMLYDGEVSTIRIGLENTSSSPVDFVKFTFTDMHTTFTRNYAEENDLPAEEAYQIEADNRNNPVFTYANVDKPLLIAPGASVVLEVQCLGKVGCGNGTIQIDYGYLNEKLPGSTFHTRQLFCDVFMTVHKALVAHSLDIYHLRASPLSIDPTTLNTAASKVVELGLGDSLRTADVGKHCLIAIDVMNSYGQPFEVSLDRTGEEPSSRRSLEPGATARMLVRLDRITLSSEELAQPIPSFKNRQFVVAKFKKSVSEEASIREMFWYRQELLKRIQAVWNEVGSKRSGSISLKSLILTKQMLEVLKGEELDITLSVSGGNDMESGVVVKKSLNEYSVASNEFVDVEALIVNNSAHTLNLMFRLEIPSDPSSTSSQQSYLSSFLVIDGLPATRLETLKPGESVTIHNSICLLAIGKYELGCILQEEMREQDEEQRELKCFRSLNQLVIDVDR